MQHLNVMDIRPDVITRTGVIQPYAIQEVPPLDVARHSISAFSSAPRAQSEIQPEEFAARAKRVAGAMASGARMPQGTSPKLLAAARMIMEGKPFSVKSAGRVARVAASPANRAVSNGRSAPARVVNQGGRSVVVDHRGKPISVADHRRTGGYWSMFRR